MKTILVAAAVIQLFCTIEAFKTVEESGEYLNRLCPITNDHLDTFCDAAINSIPNRTTKFYKEMTGCAKSFFLGKSELCKPSPDGYQGIPTCYQFFSSEGYKNFADSEETNPLNKLIEYFFAKKSDLCSPNSTKENIQKSMTEFFRNADVLADYDILLNAIIPDIASNFLGCMKEYAKLLS